MKKSVGKRKFVLVFVLLIIVSFILASCNGGSVSESTSSESSISSSSEMDYPDMGGYEFKIAAWWDGTPRPGTATGDAMVKRHEEVTKNYNCTISYIYMPNQEITEKLTSTVLSGDPFADIVWLEANTAIPVLVRGGYIMKTDDLFDFSDPKWPSLGLRSTHYNGHHYGFVADVKSTHGIWYNKSLFEKYSLPDLYELQQAGEWTWAKYLEIATSATRDTNQDGNMNTYGIAEGYPIIDRLIISNNATLLKEENGRYIFNIDDNHVRDAINFGLDLYKNGLIANFNGVTNVASFMTGNVAMYGGDAYFGEQFQMEMVDELGFVFYPKGPNANEYTCSTVNTNIMTLPVGSKRAQDTATIFEALTLWNEIDSQNEAFFDENMYNANDVITAKKMLDIAVLDKWPAFPGFAEVFWEEIIGVVVNNESTFERAVSEQKTRAQALIDSVLEGGN